MSVEWSTVNGKRIQTKRIQLDRDQLRFMRLDQKFQLLSGPRGMGKSHVLSEKLFQGIQLHGYPGGQSHFYILDLPTWKRGPKAVWEATIAKHSKADGIQYLSQLDKRDQTYHFSNGSVMHIVPVVLWDKIRGGTTFVAGFDEIALAHPAAFFHARACLRDMSIGEENLHLYAVTTPKGRRSAWLKRLFPGPNYGLVLGDKRVRGYTPKDYYDDLASGIMGKEFVDFELGNWDAIETEGQIYFNFDENYHCIPMDDLPEEYTGAWGIDWGQNAAHAVYFVIGGPINQPRSCVYWGYDELTASRITEDQFIARIKQRSQRKGYRVDYLCPDPANKLAVSKLRKAFPGARMRYEQSTVWSERIVGEEVVRTMLGYDADPAVLYFNADLNRNEPRNIVYDIGNLRTPEDKYNPGHYFDDRLDPRSKISTHSTDCARYVCVNLWGRRLGRGFSVVAKGT